jgi:hypothetical protein
MPAVTTPFFNSVLHNGWVAWLTETKVPGRKNMVTAAILNVDALK